LVDHRLAGHRDNQRIAQRDTELTMTIRDHVVPATSPFAAARASIGASLRRALGVTVVLVCALGLWASAAQADGGATIKDAPELVLGTTVGSGWTDQPINGTNGGEFWKISLKGGETLSFDTTDFAPACGAFGVDFYSPATTDADLPSAVVAVSRGSGATSFTAPFTGTWIIFVTQGGCGNASQSYDYEASLTPGPASAVTGATTIAAAPELVLGQTNASGWVNQPVDGANGGEFWKISMKGGETLSIDTTDFGFGCGAFGLDFFSPATSDADLPSAVVAVSRGSGATSFTAPFTGVWKVLVTQGGCGNTTESYDYDAALTAGPASAVTGATTIAAAPELVLGQTNASGWVNQPVDGANGGELWKISMAAGETLSIDTTDFGFGCGAFGLDFYSPATTDANFPAATAAAALGTGAVSFTAPSSGVWIVFVTQGGCGNTTESYEYDASRSGVAAPSGGATGGHGGPPSGGGSATGAVAHVALARQTDVVSSRGVASVRIACSGAPCSGGLRLTTTVAHKTVTIGTASFSGLEIGTHKLTVKLTSKGLHYLRQHHGRLGVVISASYLSGSHQGSAHVAATLTSARSRAGVPLA
jgi:hypothetical protein